MNRPSQKERQLERAAVRRIKKAMYRTVKNSKRYKAFRKLALYLQRRNQRQHFITRLEERAGVAHRDRKKVTDELLQAVQKGKLALIPRKAANGYETYECDAYDSYLLYDPVTNMLSTIVPREQLHA